MNNQEMAKSLEQVVKEYCDILDSIYDVERQMLKIKKNTYGIRAMIGDFGPEVESLTAKWGELKPQVFKAYYKMRQFVKTDVVDESLPVLTGDEVFKFETIYKPGD